MEFNPYPPGYRELDEWPVTPKPPLSLADFGGWRNGGAYFKLIDSAGHEYDFFFERFLGRLCFGWDEDADDAAFVKVGGALEREVLEILDESVTPDKWRTALEGFIRRAKHWSPNYK